MENNREVLLKVEHLCQYFRLGHRDMKAVDDVSFEIHKGETFGLHCHIYLKLCYESNITLTSSNYINNIFHN